MPLIARSLFARSNVNIVTSGKNRNYTIPKRRHMPPNESMACLLLTQGELARGQPGK